MNEDLLVRNNSAIAIWYEDVDLNDADEPYIPKLLEESYSSWYIESHTMKLFQYGFFRVYAKSMEFFGNYASEQNVMTRKANFDEEVHYVVERCFEQKTYIQHHLDHCTIHAMTLNRRSDDIPFAVFTFISIPPNSITEVELEAFMMHFKGFFYKVFESMFVKSIMRQKQLIDREASHREELFLIAKRLYDQINAESVLNEMLRSLEELYSDSEILLYLSQDYIDDDTRIRPLEFRSSSADLVTKAFISGKCCIEKESDQILILSIPLNGKQAVYGVLKISIAIEQWDESDLPAFILIADTAGSAFEHAKLYEQSNNLINELRMINELTKRLNQSLKSSEIFDYATSELIRVFNADHCYVLQLNSVISQFEIKASNAPQFLGRRFNLDYGYSGMIYRTKESVIKPNYVQTPQIASEIMDETESKSIIGAPIFVDGEVTGVILVTKREPNYFSYDNYKLLQMMGTHIGLALTNASLHAKMRKMVITDNLTNLYARHYLDEKIQQRMRKDKEGSLILVDIDFFKRVNDSYGHQVGDRILIQVSNIILSSIRSDDIAARWGGEELAIYLPNVHVDQAILIAERIRLRVQTETDPSVSVSCGVSQWNSFQDKVSVESLFYHADMALYQAKNNGRNCIRVG